MKVIEVSISCRVINGVCDKVHSHLAIHAGVTDRVREFEQELRTQLESRQGKSLDVNKMVRIIIAAIGELHLDIARETGHTRAPIDLVGDPPATFEATRELDYKLCWFLVECARDQLSAPGSTTPA